VQRSLSDIYEPNIRGRMLALPAGTDMVASRKSETGPHFAFVLEGNVHLTMKDGAAHALSAGDSIHIADQPPRIVANRGRRAARVLWVKDSRGEFVRGDATIGRGR
jgi:quercetin dioxygenase-like cupin family protein